LKELARIVRDAYPAGRQVWIEIGDEPWNYMVGGTSAWFWSLSKAQYPNGFLYEQYVLQGSIAKKCFTDVFNEGGRNRGNEIKLMLGTWTSSPGLTQSMLNFAAANNIVVDAIAITMYVNLDSNAVVQSFCWELDNEQIIDVYLHDFWYNWSSTSHNSVNTAHQASIKAYNAATGNNCGMLAYEADCAAILTGVSTNPQFALKGAVTSTQGTITVNLSTAAMAVGEYLVVDTGTKAELMQITGINGTTLSVNRGLAGLALVPVQQIAHASGVSIRSCAAERNNDLVKNPYFAQAQSSFWDYCQSWNLILVNTYAYAHPGYGLTQWNEYDWDGQAQSIGDGSDGLPDNRQCLCYPGQQYTKSPTVNFFQRQGSVRGYARARQMQEIRRNNR
jgi:hypothetical protein